MNINSLFFQIVMAVLALGIIFMYIKPAIIKIGEKQGSIEQYRVEREKVDLLTNKLISYVAKVDSISSDDQRKLLTFMPDVVDNVSVSRDIYNIGLMTGVDVENIDFNENVNPAPLLDEGQVRDSSIPFPHEFSVDLVGTYEELKDFFSSLEKNNYPLEIHDLKMNSNSVSEKGKEGVLSEELSVGLKIVTYSHL